MVKYIYFRMFTQVSLQRNLVGYVMKINNYLRFCFWTLMSSTGLVLIGTILLVCVYSLPIDRIDVNVRNSAKYFQEYGAYPQLHPWLSSQLDLHTDGIMLLEAADHTGKNAFEKSMNAYRGGIDSCSPDLTLVLHYQKGVEYTKVLEYSRYWHGFLLFVKPALSLFTYEKVLLINGIAQVVLCLIICWLMYRKKIKGFIAPFLITYGMLMPDAMATCLQFSTCYYLYSFAILFLLVVPEFVREKYIVLIFFTSVH